MKYRTKQGDTLEYIAHKHYGRSSAVVDIMQANRDIRLSDYPETLPSGLVIVLPEVSDPVREVVQIWD